MIVDKTYGHAAYGCGVCCGPDAPTMAFDPLAVSIDDYADQYVQALDSCGGGVQDFTGDFPTWWTGNTAIATANKNSIHGVAAGTTNHHAESDPMYWGVEKAFHTCPISQPQTTANTNVCDFTIAPKSGTAQDCTTGKLNSLNFVATPYPSSCSYNASKSTCATPTTSTGAIDLVNAQSPACSMEVQATATVEYYAGPPPKSGSVGTITQGFTLDFNGQNVTKTVTAQIQCP